MFARPVDETRWPDQNRGSLSLDSTIRRYRTAVEQLMRAFFDKRPAAILVGAGRLGPTHVFAKFLELVGDDADIAQVNGPCEDATGFMRTIVRDLGFETDPLSLKDLEGVLDLFLQHQRKQRRRTIVTVKEFDAHGWWVLDKIRRLIENEAENRNGLLLLLSGPPSATVVLNEPILDTIAAHAGEKIALMPFTLSETRDFVRRHVTSSCLAEYGHGDIGELVDFYATNLIHEFCDGVPDDVYRLCKTCLGLLQTAGEKRITTALVNEAAGMIGLAEPVADAPSRDGEEDGPEVEALGHLVIESAGEPTHQVSLDKGKIVVGRDQLCDHCIVGLKVSRFHSLFSLTPEGLIVADLGSTNGTFVNGDKVERYTLDADDVVGIGHARIRYVPGGERLTQASAHRRDEVRFTEEFQESSVNFVGDRFRLIETS